MHSWTCVLAVVRRCQVRNAEGRDKRPAHWDEGARGKDRAPLSGTPGAVSTRRAHGMRVEHGEAGLTASHDVGVVVENRECVLGHSARRHMEHRGHELTGNQVEVRNHEQ